MAQESNYLGIRTLEEEIVDIDNRIGHLTTVVEQGNTSQSIVNRLVELEDVRGSKMKKLKQLTVQADVTPFTTQEMTEQLTNYAAGLRENEGTEQQAAGAFEHGIMAGGLTDTERWDSSWIPVAADFCRVDDGVSAGMDRPGRKNYRAKRLKALGNAVVPQIVEAIGRAIIETEKG